MNILSMSSLRAKILTISGLTMVLIVAAALFAIASVWSANNAMERTMKNNQAANKEVIEFKKQVQEWKNVLLRGRDSAAFDKYWNNFEKTEKAVQDNGKELLAQLEEPAIKNKLAEFLNQHEQLGMAYRRGLGAFRNSNFNSSAGDKAVAGIDRAPTELLENVADDILASTSLAERNVRSAVIASLAAMAIAVLAALIVLHGFTTRMIVRPAHEAVSRLTKTADNLASLSSQSEGRTRLQLSKTGEAAAAMQQMTATIQEIARITADTSLAARETTLQVENGTNIVETVTEAIETLARRIAGALDEVGKLQEQAERIGSVLDVIRDVAGQTRLLAINAAIEASRAGSQGRGFAVVADNVRTLAGRTQQSTVEIQEMIADLQNGVRNVVSAMEKSRRLTDEIVVKAEGGRKAFADIGHAVVTVSDMNARIATTAIQQEEAAKDINCDVASIKGVADRHVADTGEIACTSQELKKLAGRFNELVCGLGA